MDQTFRSKKHYAKTLHKHYLNNPIESTIDFLFEDFIPEYASLIFTPPKTRFQNYDFIPDDEHIKLGLVHTPFKKVGGGTRKVGVLNFYRRQHGHDIYLKLISQVKGQLDLDDLNSIFKLAIWTALKNYNPKYSTLYIHFIKHFRWAFSAQLKKELVNMDYIHDTLQMDILAWPLDDIYITYSQLTDWEKYIIYSYVIQQESIKKLSTNMSFSVGQTFKEVKEIVTEE